MEVNYQPLVSIVIPVYKGYPYLKESIDSALNQTYPNIEVIVVNDGSPDNGTTEKIALDYGERIRYFYKPNGGVSTALNYGIQHMRGEWFSWLSHDDLYAPDKIEKQIQAVSDMEDKVCVVRCTTASMDAEGKSINRPQRRVSGVFTATEMMKMHSLKEVGLYGCALLIHRDILTYCGEFNQELKTVQDEDYWTRIMFSGFRFVSIPDVLVKIRVHKGQTTNLLADLFEPERQIFANKVMEYYQKAPEINESNIITFISKQAKERRSDIEKKLLEAIEEIRPISSKEKAQIHMYEAFGCVYARVKMVYRMLIIKSKRK
jgi:hypothetical protein